MRRNNFGIIHSAALLLMLAVYLAAPAGHADPTLPSQEPDATERLGGFGELGEVGDIEVVVGADGSTYALMASWSDRIRIINITDPARPAPVADMVGGQDGFVRGFLADIEVVSVANGTYVLIPDITGWEMVQVANITDPARPAPVSVIKWQGDAGQDWISDLEVAVVDERAYVLMANPARNAVQITEITNPGEPRWVATVFHVQDCLGQFGEIVQMAGGAYQTTAGWNQMVGPIEAGWTYRAPDCFEALAGASEVVAAEMSGGYYALVAGRISGEVLVMDITYPGGPEPVARFPVLGEERAAGPVDVQIEVAHAGQSTYALVAVPQENIVRLVDVSRPYFPVLIGEMSIYPERVQEVEAVMVGNNTYMLVAGWGDGGLSMFEITDPAYKRHISVWGEENAPTDRIRVVEAARVGNGTYVLVAGSQSGSLWMVNITDPQDPFWLADR